MALQDTHLIVLQRKSIEAVINNGKKMVDRQRWHITKSQLEKCRRIFTYDPAVRNILDLKMVMESTVNCEFFQNISPFLHIELCKRATFQTVLILILNIGSHDWDMTVCHFAIYDRIRVNDWLNFYPCLFAYAYFSWNQESTCSKISRAHQPFLCLWCGVL